MNEDKVQKIIDAVLYEGYILYPYRASSKKNSRQRFTFGRVYPESYSGAQNGAEPCMMQTECLLKSETAKPRVTIEVRFLHPQLRRIRARLGAGGNLCQEPEYGLVEELRIDGNIHRPWMEAVERRISTGQMILDRERNDRLLHSFTFPATYSCESLLDEKGQIAGVVERIQEPLSGLVEVCSSPIEASCFKLTVRIHNQTKLGNIKNPNDEAILMHTFASTHALLLAKDAEFVSLLDPPAALRKSAAECANIGTWPVLLGDAEARDRDAMLSSPIILYDYPRIAPESAGSYLDGTEIDEILALRVLTMTDEEKKEMRQVDEIARKMLDRTENLSMEQWTNMHGRMSMQGGEEFFNPARRMQSVTINGVELKKGDRVRLCPKHRADAFDLLLTGKVGVIESVEEDVDARVQVAVVIEDDPGMDLGMMRQPGHRFFYGPEEIEPMSAGEP